MSRGEDRADIVAEEAQRARWARWLRANAMDDAVRPDFGKGGVGSRAEDLGVRFVVLPSDPEAAVVDLDQAFWERISGLDGKAPPFSNRPLKWGYEDCPSSTGGARVDKDGKRSVVWRRWLMVYRCGAVEFGLPAWVRGEERALLLLPTVGRIWAALDLHRDLVEQHKVHGPFLAALALLGTQTARLRGFGQGWEQSIMFDDERRCLDSNLLICEQFAAWPEAEGAKALALRLGGRIEDAFGSKARRFSGSRNGNVVEFDGEAFD